MKAIAKKSTKLLKNKLSRAKKNKTIIYMIVEKEEEERKNCHEWIILLRSSKNHI